MSTSSCVCFGWCNAKQVSVFFASLPESLQSPTEPWGHVVRAVYRSKWIDWATVNLRRFGVFTFRRQTLSPLDPADPPHFDRQCALPTPWCGPGICAPWRSGFPAYNLSDTQNRLTNQGFAPWPWMQQQRSQYRLRRPHAQVQYGRTDMSLKQRHIKQVKFKIDLTDNTSVLLFRSSNNETTLQPMPNNSWVEVYRTRTSARWYARNGVAEGVNYGCWMYPLLPPFTRGTGVYVNTGQTLVLADRNEASRHFRAMRASVSSKAGATVLGSCDADDKCAPAKGGRLLCSDRCWARRAHAAGYDSVQILRGPDFMPELIVTRSACVSQRDPIGTCPPAEVALRTGEGATRECNCSERSPILNCINTPIA